MLTDDIKNLFNPQHVKYISEMRDKYFRTRNLKDIVGVRPDILMGWQESYEHGFDDIYPNKPVVRDLQRRLEKNAQVMHVAIPYMKKIFSFIDHKSFWLTFMDTEGVILKLIGTPKMLEELKATGLIEGSNRGEDAPYCGLFHLVYKLKKPFMLVATEHASPIDDNLAGSASPIIDLRTKKVLGYIGISGHWWDSHVHTLGMAIIAGEAISQALALQTANRKILDMNKSIKNINRRLNTTVESVDSGLVYFDDKGNIKTINKNAVQLLGIQLRHEAILGKNIFNFIDNKLTIDKIHCHTNKNEIYHYDLLTPLAANVIGKGEYPLYVTIQNTIQEDRAEYIMIIKKRAEVHQTAAKIVYPTGSFTFEDIIGQSEEMSKVKRLAQMAAQHDPAVMILGESGTGKELFAQAIHHASNRAKGPFVAINCGAIPRTLIESELFGYEKGAFTGADKNGHPGKFELADGGTVFLDEIGDMPYDVQITLLRVLQTRQVLRIGGTKPIKVNVRIISATNKDLDEEIKNKTFRDDLYYRLNVFTIPLPPLRERKGDVEILAKYFFSNYQKIYNKKVKGFSREALQMLNKYDWPGNIRQLENAVDRALIVCQTEYIELEDFSNKLITETNRGENIESEKLTTKSDKLVILKTLQTFNNNISKTAKYLGLSRPTLYKKIKKYGISKNNNIYS